MQKRLKQRARRFLMHAHLQKTADYWRTLLFVVNYTKLHLTAFKQQKTKQNKKYMAAAK